MFPFIYCPFLLGCCKSILRRDLGFMSLWLMKSLLLSFHCTSKKLLTSLDFLENLSPQAAISETGIWGSFSFTDKANEIISLAISSGKLTNLGSRLTFHGFSTSSQNWLHKNYVITARFICNGFSTQMFHCSISKYNCARSFLCRMLGLIKKFRFYVRLKERERLNILFSCT